MKNFLNDKDNALQNLILILKPIIILKCRKQHHFQSVPIYSNTVYKTDENRELPFELRQSFQDEYEISFAS
jgi:hypothetical protein